MKIRNDHNEKIIKIQGIYFTFHIFLLFHDFKEIVENFFFIICRLTLSVERRNIEVKSFDHYVFF